MRETPGKRMRRRLRLPRSAQAPLPAAALGYATGYGWPVLPGAGLAPDRETRPAAPVVMHRPGRARRCGCPAADCAQPGAHPFEPPLLAATSDARMVAWWWERRPDAPVILATGGRGPSAVSLPAVAGARALRALDRLGVRTGPVLATPDRWALLVRPYSLADLGELLSELDWVPATLRFHGDGGYLALPPAATGPGRVRWEREPGTPEPGTGAPWLPEIGTVIGELVEAGVAMSTSSGPGGR
ncbi:bifunctional DNA primase/polymerase [Streptomyces sp. NPDC051940]|uniref:bifunctional DNA primase/polymerase n=1 Tax=Streptomyces sp. NPDC051940 TaxID=3155675 RepID=UPI00342C3D04